MSNKQSNLELATKIIEKHIGKHHTAGTWWADLLPVLGMQLGSLEAKKPKAIEDMAKQLAGELDNGALDLSDDWAKRNGF